MRVIRIHFTGDSGGMIVAAKDKKGILEEIETFIEELSVGESVSLAAEEMSTEDYEGLPEFTGW